MSSVSRQENESIERHISRFRRVVLRNGILKEVRAKRYFRKDTTRVMMRKKAQYRETKRNEELGM